jgi:hypothetical protein
MVFSSPLLLWALSLVLLPIAIHLFQFRRYKKLYFSDISLLKEVKSQSQTKNQLKHLVILFARILFVALLVLAFCEPIIPALGEQKSDANHISIYVDNSFSMQAETDRGQLLQEAVRTAYEIASTAPKGVSLQLITNDFSAEQKRFSDLDDFATLLDDIQISPRHKLVNEVVRFTQQSLRDESTSETNLYLISDFKNTTDSSLVNESDSNLTITLVPLRAAVEENISIDSAWVDSPIIQMNREVQLHIRVTNTGNQAVQDIPVQISLENKTIASAFVSIDANSYLDTALTIIPEDAKDLTGEISLEDLPISFDNAYFFSLSVLDKIRVAEIRGENIPTATPFQKLFSGSHFDFIAFNEGEIIQDSLSTINLLVINQPKRWNSGIVALCLDHLKKGSNLVVVMPQNAEQSLISGLESAFGFEVQSWDTSNLSVNALADQHYAFNEVFESKPQNINYPYTKGYYSINKQSIGTSIATLFNQKPLIASNSVELGEVFLITSPLQDQYTNLHRHALFVPFLMNISSASGISKPLSYSLETNRIPLIVDDEYIVCQRIGDSGSFIPALSYDGLLMNNQINKAGNYIVKNQANETLAKFSFNYDRDESAARLSSFEEIENYFNSSGMNVQSLDVASAELSENITQTNASTELWPIFVSAAVLLLLFETLLLKRFS